MNINKEINKMYTIIKKLERLNIKKEKCVENKEAIERHLKCV